MKLVFQTPLARRESRKRDSFLRKEKKMGFVEKKNQNVAKLVFGGLLVALGILLPQAFHIFGTSGGSMFLPIHIPVLMAGMLLGPYYGGIIGFLVPILSSLLTGMPPVPKVYFMLVELITYGIVIGVMIRRSNVYISLLVAMISGRILYGCSLVVGVKILHLTAPFANQAAFLGGIVTGIPGILLQFLILPALYKALKKGGIAFER